MGDRDEAIFDDVIPGGKTCGSCRFWRRDRTSEDGFGGGRRPWGQCRRMPPALPEIGEDKLVHIGVWPHTDERDWCGEWQPLAAQDQPRLPAGPADPPPVSPAIGEE